MPTAGARRVPGLRRNEVATLAGSEQNLKLLSSWAATVDRAVTDHGTTRGVSDQPATHPQP